MTKQQPQPSVSADPGTTLDQGQRSKIHSSLLAWYAEHGRRHLPWRHTQDPYAILVAEMMLQQTQVDRVLPKYIAFVKRFPTFAVLAEAPTAEVIRAWAGLGYNRRAVALQAIARHVTTVLSGELPSSVDELLGLRGIGRYTAGAIACFAFGLPVATVDTNIRRVLWRLFYGAEARDQPAGYPGARESLALATWALPSGAAYDWQQALMDLGATVCLGRRPLCELCPLTSCCRAYADSARLTLFPSGEAVVAARRLAQVAESPAGYSASGTSKRAGRPRPAGKTRSDFASSSRYFRGRVVEILRNLGPGEWLLLFDLGLRIRPDFGDDPQLAPWLYGIVEGLARDGLVRLEEIVPEENPEENRDGEGRRSVSATEEARKLRVALP